MLRSNKVSVVLFLKSHAKQISIFSANIPCQLYILPNDRESLKICIKRLVSAFTGKRKEQQAVFIFKKFVLEPKQKTLPNDVFYAKFSTTGRFISANPGYGIQITVRMQIILSFCSATDLIGWLPSELQGVSIFHLVAKEDFEKIVKLFGEIFEIAHFFTGSRTHVTI